MKTKYDSYNELTDDEIIAARNRLDEIMNERGLEDESKTIYGTVTVDVTPIVRPFKIAGDFVMDCINGVFTLCSFIFIVWILVILYALIFR